MTFSATRAFLSVVLLAAGFAAAQPVQAQHVGRCGSCGTIQDIDNIVYDADKGVQGAVVGGIIGGLLGNQIGSGSGRTAATVAGVVGGGLVGRKVDKNNSGNGEPGVRLLIKMDKGGTRTIELHGRPRLYKGDRVKVKRNSVELL